MSEAGTDWPTYWQNRLPRSWQQERYRIAEMRRREAEAARQRAQKALEQPIDDFVVVWSRVRGTEPYRPAKPLRMSAKRLIALCAAAGKQPVGEILGPRRARVVCRSRQAAAYLMVKHCTHLSLPRIGKLLGGRDHSTIIHARDKVIKDLAAGGEMFGAIIEHVEARLG
jgi:hypothetical protein